MEKAVVEIAINPTTQLRLIFGIFFFDVRDMRGGS